MSLEKNLKTLQTASDFFGKLDSLDLDVIKDNINSVVENAKKDYEQKLKDEQSLNADKLKQKDEEIEKIKQEKSTEGSVKIQQIQSEYEDKLKKEQTERDEQMKEIKRLKDEIEQKKKQIEIEEEKMKNELETQNKLQKQYDDSRNGDSKTKRLHKPNRFKDCRSGYKITRI